MAAITVASFAAVVFAHLFASAGALYGAAYGADIISDITTSESDESSALRIKVEQFWEPVLHAAEDVKMEQHLELYKDAEDVLNGLPAENTYVREALTEALAHLKAADDASFKQALASKKVAKDKLDAPCDGSQSTFSFLTGGGYKNFLTSALNRFVGGRYSDKLVEHVEQRQADILPVLRGTASVTGSILSDCRLASKRGFDIRKYDIYNRGVPKTPQNAKEIADRIIDAAGETRHRFTRGITDMVRGITRDAEGKREDASATVTKASVKLLHTSIAKAESQLSPFGSDRPPASGPLIIQPQPIAHSTVQIIDL